MDIYEAQKLFQDLNPGKAVSFEFDEKCQRAKEILMTDGLPNLCHFIEYNKVLVTVEGASPVYVPIVPHRNCVAWSEVKRDIGSMASSDVHIDHSEISNLTKLKEEDLVSYEARISELCLHSGLSKTALEDKVFPK